MAFPKGNDNQGGLNKTYGNSIAADERSNKGPSGSSKTIGNIEGRLTFSKSSVSSLNTGEPGVTQSAKTMIPGKAP